MWKLEKRRCLNPRKRRDVKRLTSHSSIISQHLRHLQPTLEALRYRPALPLHGPPLSRTFTCESLFAKPATASSNSHSSALSLKSTPRTAPPYEPLRHLTSASPNVQKCRANNTPRPPSTRAVPPAALAPTPPAWAASISPGPAWRTPPGP